MGWGRELTQAKQIGDVKSYNTLILDILGGKKIDIIYYWVTRIAISKHWLIKGTNTTEKGRQGKHKTIASGESTLLNKKIIFTCNRPVMSLKNEIRTWDIRMDKYKQLF